MTIWSPEVEKQTGPRYLAIVRALSNDIDRGVLNVGDRLPTHRELGDRLGVAVGTITRAYAEAERLGLVRGEIGRGTFVASLGRGSNLLRKDAPPARYVDLAMNEPLSAADPDLAVALRAMSKRQDLQDLLRYHPPEGIPRHRATGAKWIGRCGVETKAEDVVVCSGAQHALVVTLSALASPGDWIFVEDLTYPGIQAVAKLLQLRLHGIAMDENGLIPEAFETACRQRRAKALYCVPTLQNPTVTTLPDRRRRAIARIAREHGVAIVEDDVMRPLVPDPPIALTSLMPENSYFVTTLSKAISGGLRVAYVACPPGTASRLGESIWATLYMVPPLMAEIAAAWIEDRTAERAVQWKRDGIRKRVAIAREVLEGMRLHTNANSYHAWLELPESWTSAQFAAETRRRGVAVTPSEAFRAGSGGSPRAVRLCLGAVDDERTLRAALNVVADVARKKPEPGRALV